MKFVNNVREEKNKKNETDMPNDLIKNIKSIFTVYFFECVQMTLGTFILINADPCKR